MSPRLCRPRDAGGSAGAWGWREPACEQPSTGMPRPAGKGAAGAGPGEQAPGELRPPSAAWEAAGGRSGRTLPFTTWVTLNLASLSHSFLRRREGGKGRGSRLLFSCVSAASCNVSQRRPQKINKVEQGRRPLRSRTASAWRMGKWER